MNNLGGNTMGGGMGNQAGGVGQKEDYGDKALDKLEQKMGVQQNRGINEKITDTARGMFEKATGKHVSDKVSN